MNVWFYKWGHGIKCVCKLSCNCVSVCVCVTLLVPSSSSYLFGTQSSALYHFESTCTVVRRVHFFQPYYTLLFSLQCCSNSHSHAECASLDISASLSIAVIQLKRNESPAILSAPNFPTRSRPDEISSLPGRAK